MGVAKTRSLRVEIDPEVYGRVKVAAARRDESICGLVRALITANLDELESPEHHAWDGKPATASNRV
jgi:hypothetical protein